MTAGGTRPGTRRRRRARRGEAGFTLIEVVVAFAVVTLILGAVYEVIAGAWRSFARAQVREQTLTLARAQFEALGVSEPLQPGESTGSYPTGVGWRLTVETVAASLRGRAVRIVLDVRDPAGRPLLRLETFKLDQPPAN